MAGDMLLTDHNRTLKEALIESLSAILSPDQKTRSNGEDQVKALEVTEGIIIFKFSHSSG